MSSVDKHGKLDLGRPAEIHKRIQCCPYRPTGEQDIVNKDNDLFRNIEGDVGLPDDRQLLSAADVVPVK